jgi:dGTP triphosphohydrolase
MQICFDELNALSRNLDLQNNYCFMRLEDVTQVLAPKKSRKGGIYMTRQTHSFEVSTIAKYIAIKLGFNLLYQLDNICLAHDLGHSPFGHDGVKAINEFGIEHGYEGFLFDDNNATFDVIVNNSIKLSNYELASIVKYPDNLREDQSWINDILVKEIAVEEPVWKNKFRTVACEIMDEADRIAYVTSDVVDSFTLGFSKKTLAPFLRKIINKHPAFKGEIDLAIIGASNKDKRLVREAFFSIKVKMADMISWDFEKGFIDNSLVIALILDLQKFTFDKFIYNKIVMDERALAIDALKSVFQYTLDNPETMPSFYRKKYHKADDKFLLVRRYIAELGDSVVLNLSKKIKKLS